MLIMTDYAKITLAQLYLSRPSGRTAIFISKQYRTGKLPMKPKRNNPQYSFQWGPTTVNFPQCPKGGLNSEQGFVNCIFQINGNKGTKRERNKPDVFFLGRFLATFKSQHHCQCCIVRCYLFVRVHRSYG